MTTSNVIFVAAVIQETVNGAVRCTPHVEEIPREMAGEHVTAFQRRTGAQVCGIYSTFKVAKGEAERYYHHFFMQDGEWENGTQEV